MAMSDCLYHYKFTVQRVVDGDTIVGKLDKGRKNFDEDVRLRMLYINAPEIERTTPEEKAKGEESKAYLKSLIEGKTVIVNTIKEDNHDSFGRMLAIVYLPEQDDLNVNEHMVQQGYAVNFMV